MSGNMKVRGLTSKDQSAVEEMDEKSGNNLSYCLDDLEEGEESDCHLNDINFDEETLDKTFVEGVKKPFSFVNELIDDDFPHQSFDEWEENLAKDAPEMGIEDR